MGSPRWLGRAIAVLCTATALAGLTLPASADTSSTVQPTTWAYTDSAAPTAKFVDPGGEAPVGAQVFASGTVHSTRTYLTFDISRFAGSTVHLAQFVTTEKAVADCGKPRAVQVWLTDTASAPTWAAPPKGRTRLPGPIGLSDSCPSPRLTWDAADLVQRAVDAGRATVTFEMRLPDGQQDDPSLFRLFNHAPLLYMVVNHAPNRPTDVQVDSKACGAKPLLMANTGDHQFTVTPTDPDQFDQLTVEFAWWPADHPGQVTTRPLTPGPGGYRQLMILPQSTFADNTAYVLRVRVDDGHATATALRRFTTDFVAPPAPTVSSSDYPTDVITGGSGIPGAFTFSANGNNDTVGFRYTVDYSSGHVAAGHRGGTATVSIVPPRIGANRVSAAAVDAAGNVGRWTDYDFAVNANRPTVTCTPEFAAFDTPRTCTITRYDATDVGLLYQVDNGPSTGLAPRPDGTATFTTTLDEPGRRVRVDVRARLANGNLTDLSSCWLSADVG